MIPPDQRVTVSNVPPAHPLIVPLPQMRDSPLLIHEAPGYDDYDYAHDLSSPSKSMVLLLICLLCHEFLFVGMREVLEQRLVVKIFFFRFDAKPIAICAWNIWVVYGMSNFSNNPVILLEISHLICYPQDNMV